MILIMMNINEKYEILTPTGWQDFRGVTLTGVRKVFRLGFSDGSIVTATGTHTFFTPSMEKIEVKDMIVGYVYLSMDGSVVLEAKEEAGEEPVYDVIEVKDPRHQFIIEGNIVTKNCDEFAFVPPNIASDFWVAIQPVLSTGGGCIITSTPKNDEDQFAKIWKEANMNTDEYGNPRPDGLGINHFFPMKVVWSQHPERDETWAAPFRASLGPAKFAQEMECEFVSDDETLIDSILLSTLKGQDPDFYTGQVRWYQEPEPNHTFLVALDPSLGTGSDAAAIQVFQVPGMVQIAEWQHNKTPPKGQIRILMQILYMLVQTLGDDPRQEGDPMIYWTVENNTIGETVLQVIEDTGEHNFPGVLVSEKKKKGSTRRFRKGLYTSSNSKLNACAKFKSLMESGRMTVKSSQLIREMKNFVGNGVSYSAKSGEHDDLVMATLLTVRLLDNVLRWLDEEISQDFKEVVNPEDEDNEPMPVLIG